MRRYDQVAIACLVAGLLVTTTHSLVAQDIDLSLLGITHPGFFMEGVDEEELMGCSVSGAGDVNNDGLSDLIVGAFHADPYGRHYAGESYVVFGKIDSADVSLGSLGSGGFSISGIDADDLSGSSVSSAGDVNGDGLADVIIGAWKADPGGDSKAGESYVVFGKVSSTTVDLGTLGSSGFRIDGIDAFDYSGYSVSGAGDVNGDELADLIVSAIHADPGGDFNAGESYVIFGKADGATVDLANLGGGGFRIDGIDTRDYAGFSVSGAGDVNGDGLADLVLGAPESDGYGFYHSGESYVVFGKTDTTPVDLGMLGSGGFLIYGVARTDETGISVSGAGDVNGDGLADLIVGAHQADAHGDTIIGSSFVVFGKADANLVDLRLLGAGGFRIDGIDDSDRSGRSVSGAGDVNGDGLADIVVGAKNAESQYNPSAGESYVVFGKADNALVDLAMLKGGGFRINGIDSDDRSGCSVSGAGDVNGDGLADLIVGADHADIGDEPNAGETYVVFSTSTPPSSATYKAFALAGDAPRLPIGITGDGSDDSSPSSRCWIDFSDGSGPGLNGSSMQTVTLTRDDADISGGLTPAEAARIRWEVSTDRTGWNEATFTFKYTRGDIAGLSEGTLSLFHAAAPSGPWTKVPATIDTIRNMVSVSSSSGGHFTLAGTGISGLQVMGE